MTDTRTAPLWRRILAAILDFFTIFLVAGYGIAMVTGDTTEGGFQLDGLPALVAIALVILYFVAGHYLGGTIWQRILRTR